LADSDHTGGANSQSELVALQKSFSELQDRCAKLSEAEKQAVASATNTVKMFEAEKKAWQEQMAQLKVLLWFSKGKHVA
jgi:predicted  nucleic acid-binding Zn-ribbon protein